MLTCNQFLIVNLSFLNHLGLKHTVELSHGRQVFYDLSILPLELLDNRGILVVLDP